jgi:hypothetical protein
MNGILATYSLGIGIHQESIPSSRRRALYFVVQFTAATLRITVQYLHHEVATPVLFKRRDEHIFLLDPHTQSIARII